MAVVTTLKLKMGTLSGVKTFSFKYVNAEASTASVKALGEALIANGAIYKYPPQTIDSAVFETTQTSEVDFDE